MFAPELSATEGIGIRWGILGIAAVGHGIVIAALMSVHIKPPRVVPPQVLTVSAVDDEAPAKAPVPTPAPESQQPKQKPLIQPNKLPYRPPPSTKATPVPVAAEMPAKEIGDATPESPQSQWSDASGADRKELSATPAGMIGAEPGPVTPPRFDADYLSNPAPPYPPASRSMGEQGKVLLSVLVSSAGTSAEVRLRAGSGFERLDQAALEAVRHWKFVPARQGGEAVAAWVVVPILFTLRR